MAANSQVADTIEVTSASLITDEQRNSINMLNYLVVVTQEIRESPNSQLMLDQVYAELINNTEPSAVDERTLTHIEGVLDVLDSFRMIAVKRKRLQRVYEKARADSIMQAVPNAGGLLSAVISGDVIRAVASIVYMAVDSVASYSSALSEAESQYLEGGWELEDEAQEALHDIRQQTFSYMVRTVNEYDLPSGITLSENEVDDFVSWCSDSNVSKRTQYLEDNIETYRSFGPYWLALARAYYEADNWEQCLSAVDEYEKLGVETFRYDVEYARVLPMATSAAIGALDGAGYAERAPRYAQEIVDNSAYDDWALRYSAALSYLSLYSRDGDAGWVEKAYDLILGNVTNLVGTQKELNVAYLAPVVEEEIPQGATKDEEKEIKSYNSLLKEERKTELPPVHEPLLVNLVMLKDLVEALGSEDEVRERIDGILFGDGAPLFLADALNCHFTFGQAQEPTSEGITISSGGKKIEMPVRCACASSAITVMVSSDNGEATFNDWVVERVKRDTEGELDTFTAMLKSDSAGGYKFEPGMQVTLSIDPYPGQNIPVVERSFKAVDTKDAFYKHLFVWESSIGFVEE